MHLLLLPKPPTGLSVASIASLRREHLPALRSLHSSARCIAAALAARREGTEVRLGYHALPSLEPLHLHLISQDFDSECLKNKVRPYSRKAACYAAMCLIAVLPSCRSTGTATRPASSSAPNSEHLLRPPLLHFFPLPHP
jgi:hypothetical protein